MQPVCQDREVLPKRLRYDTYVESVPAERRLRGLTKWDRL